MKQIRETLSGLFEQYIVRKKAMFIPILSVATFMLVGYAAMDRQAPVIFSDSIDLAYGDTIDPDVIDVEDNRDARDLLTIEINTKSLNENQLGSYEVEVKATDLFNNTATKTIIVNVVDQVGPEFELVGNSKGYIVQVPVYGSEEIGNYIKAVDNVDGDVTPFIEATADLDTSKLGFQTISLKVEDSSGNVSEKVYEFAVSDLTAPEIELIKGKKVTIDYDSDFSVDSIAKVTDNYDKDVKVELKGKVDTKLEDEVQTVEIIATDSSNNVSKEKVECVVKDITGPEIELSVSKLRVQLNEKVNVKDYITSAIDNKDGDLTSKIKVSSIDTSSTGTKKVTYTVTDKAGNETKKTLEVTVTNGGNPEIAAAALAQLGVNQDCTMLVTNSLKAIGIYFHGAPAKYLSLGHVVPYSEALPGDLIYYSRSALGMPHIAVYIGNGQAVHGGWLGKTTAIAGAYRKGASAPVFIRVDR